jgi:hypothetical protein
MPMPNTFLELEAAKTVFPRTLVHIFHSYANGGWAITAEVVTRLMDRTPLTFDELNAMHRSALIGKNIQYRRGFRKDADAYNEVADYAWRRMFRMQAAVGVVT